MLKYLLNYSSSRNFLKNFQSLLIQPSYHNFTTKINLLNEKYALTPSKEIVISPNHKDMMKRIEVISQNKEKTPSNSIKQMIRKIFFPRDYPNSVKEGYYHYTKYTFYVGILINLMDFLATQVLINSMGVSKNKSMKLSAGLNWVIKDGIGQFSSIFFATKYNHSFEQNLKQWRVLTLMIYNTALFTEILCMKIKNPYNLLFTASLAQSLKMCATFGNVSARVGIMDNFCKEKNISDLQNKSTSQSNLSFAIGTLMGMGISLYCPLTAKNVTKLISFLSTFYLYFAFKSLDKVMIPTLNFARGNILFRNYLKTGKIISMKEVNKKEGGKFMRIKNFHFSSCSLDHALTKINGNSTLENNGEYIDKTINLFKNSNKKFLCLVDIKNNNYFDLYTVLQHNSTSEDVLLAFLYSVKMHQELSDLKNINKSIVIDLMKKNINYIDELNKEKLMKELKEKEFDIKTNLLEKRFLRYQFVEPKI